MTNTQYQIMVLLFLILVVVYLSGCKLNEGMYSREFDYTNYKNDQGEYDFIYDVTTPAGTTSDGDYAKIMAQIKEIQRDILDFTICKAGPSGSNADFKDKYQVDYTTGSGGKCNEFNITKAQIEAKIGNSTTPNTLAYNIAEFNRKQRSARTTITELDIAKIFDKDATSLPSKYSGWATPSKTRFETAGAENTMLTVQTASNPDEFLELHDLSENHKRLRREIVSKLQAESRSIKSRRAQLDSDLAELNQLGNSQAMINKMTMDSTVYASLIWSVLATSLIAYLVTIM